MSGFDAIPPTHWSVTAARIVGSLAVVLSFGALLVNWVVGNAYHPENTISYNVLGLVGLAVLVVCLVFFWSVRARASHLFASLMAAAGLALTGLGAYLLVTDFGDVILWVWPLLLGVCLLIVSIVPRLADISSKETG